MYGLLVVSIMYGSTMQVDGFQQKPSDTPKHKMIPNNTPIRVSSVKQKIPDYLLPRLKHRTEPIQKLPIYCAQQPPKQSPPIHLPSHLNPKGKSQDIILSPSNLTASYNGTGKSDMDATSVRANLSVPKNIGIYYYEATITSQGRDGYIGIGFQAPQVALGRLPGNIHYQFYRLGRE